MTKLAILLSLTIAAPVFACPNMDHDEAPARTADKDKGNDTTAKKDTAKDQKPADAKDAAKDQKPADAKTKTDGKKPGDKVSIK